MKQLLLSVVVLGFVGCGDSDRLNEMMQDIGEPQGDPMSTPTEEPEVDPPGPVVIAEPPAPAPTPREPEPPAPEPPAPGEPTGGVALQNVRFGPWLQAPGQDRITILAETWTPVAVTVELDGQSQTSPVGTHHELTFSGLAPSTRYWYRLVIGGQAGFVKHASTLPAEGEPIRVVVMGDPRNQPAIQATVNEAIAAEGADLLISTGDLVLSGSREAEWDQFFAVTGDLLAENAMISAAGNHEYSESGKTRYGELVAQPPGNTYVTDFTFSFDVGTVHIAVLDSNASFSGQAQWLVTDLIAARQRGAQRVFVVLHHGPYSCGVHGGESWIQSRLLWVHSQTPIDAVFGGHDHIYERGVGASGLRYWVTGGAGANLYPCVPTSTTKAWASTYHYLVVTVSGSSVRVIAKQPDGTVIDDASF